MSANDRFALILVIISTVIGLVGWLLRGMILDMRTDTAENTKAILALTNELSQFRVQAAEREAAAARADATELRAQAHAHAESQARAEAETRAARGRHARRWITGG